MKKLISIDLVPTLEKDDFDLIKKIFWGYKDFEAEKRVREILKNYFPKGEILFFSSARSALTFLLENIKDNQRNQVINQAFTCLVVPNATKFAGLEPVFVDIDETFNLNIDDLKNKVNDKTLAIIVQNTFGIPAKIEEILKIAKEKNIFVIENLTHSLGAKYKNNYLGNLGDFALLSFNRNKVITSLIGGALIINNEEYKEKLKIAYEKIDKFSSFKLKKILLTGIFLYLYKNNYNFLTKSFLFFLRKIGFIWEMITETEKKSQKPKDYFKKFPLELFSLLENQLKKLDKFNQQRKEIAKIYLEKFDELNKFLPKEAEPIFLRFPIFKENRGEILKNFKKLNIHLGDWYFCSISPCVKNLEIFGYKGDCQNSEIVSKKILNLPTLINKEDADLILKNLE
jgi:dTDP-4-amino-4,6-dideoxygalactose transaminase